MDGYRGGSGPAGRPPTTGSGVKPPGRSWFDRPVAADDSRPPRSGWAPGHYTCTCVHCDRAFYGEKRAWECADCAYARPKPPPRVFEDPYAKADRLMAELGEALLREAAALKEINRLEGELLNANVAADVATARAEMLQARLDGELL